MKKVLAWVRRHAVRIVVVVAAGAPLVADYLQRLPWEWTAVASGVALVIGEYAQRVEDNKTAMAALTGMAK